MRSCCESKGMGALPRLLARVAVIGAGLLLPITAPAEDPPAPNFRTVEVTVRKPDGSPAPGVKVDLRGLDRDAFETRPDAPGLKSTFSDAWHFVSDERGRFTARFGDFRSAGSEEVAEKFMPGWGAYHFYAEAPGIGSAVSELLVNPSSDEDAYTTRSLMQREEPWTVGLPTRLKKNRTKLTLQLKPGVRLAGRVVDGEGKPVPGFPVELWHDLGSDTHTGRGGEIFPQQTTSGADGAFTFESIHPNQFFLGPTPDEHQAHVWVRTRVRQRWAEENVDEITPREGEREIPILIITAPGPPFRYFGRVTDEAAQPIAGAKLSISVSRHRLRRTHEDDHSSIFAVADAEGRYEARSASPFVNFFHVTAHGFGDGGKEAGDDRDAKYPAAPGEYNFTLRRTPDSAAK